MFPFLHHHRLCLFLMDEVFHKFILYGVSVVFLCSSPLWPGCCSVPRGSSCGDWRETRILRECPISSLMRSTRDQRKGILLCIKQQYFINCTYENIPVILVHFQWKIFQMILYNLSDFVGIRNWCLFGNSVLFNVWFNACLQDFEFKMFWNNNVIV